VLAPLNERWEDTTQRMNRLYQGLNRQTRPSSGAFGRTLSLGGARNVGNGIVFTARASAGRYWRAVVYDTYTGRQWLNTGEEEREFAADEVVPNADWQLRQAVTQTITLAMPSAMLYAAPDIRYVDVPFEASVRPVAANTATGDPAVEVTTARARTTLAANESYRVVSGGTVATVRALEATGSDYPESVREQYLQLPENTSAQVIADAAALTADLTTVYDKVRAIETYLRGIPYNDEIEVPPADRDPIEYFLYDIREGYCDYYATAMAVMVRSLGIPARVVSGYAEGSYDPEMGYFTVTERDAHTWVEVYFPGYGWIEFEPTAGESQLNRPSGDDPSNANPYESLIDPSTGAPIPQDEMLDEFQDPGMEGTFDPSLQDKEGAFARSTWWLWALLTPLLLVVGGYVIWRTRVRGPNAFDPDLPPILFARLQRWAERLGLRPPIHHTPYEQARRLTRAVPEGQAPIVAITDSYVRYRFARHASAAQPGRVATAGSVGAPDEGLAASWQTLEPVLWRAWLNKLLRRTPGKTDDPFTLNGE
jgi:transglutaminase-like putative cysteine protease